jgi:peptidoglycan/LPS O-acetylase OafA/YrhL
VIRFRADVEGLRAVAVLLVVLGHLSVPGFRGGFFGVDVFFVVSGYLITSLLAAEYAGKAEANGGRGSISIPRFYVRRARRILPAALTVVAAVVVAGSVLLNELRVAQIRHDAVWAVLFASNVNFMRQATDYFSQGLVDSSPFQHYWSLAVEEQFYLVWPALFLLAARLAFVGGPRRWRVRVGATVCAIGAASLAWSVVATERGPLGAYFSTFTRAWELALGALLGIATTSATRLPRLVAGAASAAGVALLAVSFAVIGAGTPYPGAAALLPTIAAALLILAGITERTPLPSRVLCLPPLRFLGRISYSVYLWHWPLIVFAAALYPTWSRTVQVRLLLLLLTLGVSTLSYYAVEQPGRRIGVSRWPRRAPARRRARGANLVTATVGACALVAVFVGLLSAIAPERSPAVRLPAGPLLAAGSARIVTAPGSPPVAEATYAAAVRSWQREIRAGLRLRRLPASLEPLSRHLSAAFPPPCVRGLPGLVPHECVVGNPAAAHTAVLDGDSHAEMLRNAVWRAFDPRTWSVHIFAQDGCGWAGGTNGSVSAATCARFQAEALARIRALHPDVLLLSEHLVVTPFRSRADIASSLAAFTRAAGRTIVIGHTPLPESWSSCLVGSDISRCFATLDPAFRSDARMEQRLATGAGAAYVDSSAWLCVRAGRQTVCPPVIDGVPAFEDDTHVGAEYQLKLVPIVRALLVALGLPVGRGS